MAMSAEEILALPNVVTTESFVRDGITYEKPIMKLGRVQTYSPEDYVYVRDEAGLAWRPYQDTDDKWYKERVVL